MRILNRPLKIGIERNKILTAVIFDVVRRLQERILNLQNVLPFQGARKNECNFLRLSLRKFSRNSQTINSIVRRSLVQNFTQIVQ